ncbi:butyryl-CoA dehydrogenase domain protein [Clostridioides difficile CD206]|nr:butyryl-CoA dehydrogenase domain protein [Clostridioides difficile]EQF71044.1 butyryl-CoA dehydrogenase domain protein [Clostridioides difficile CD206]
MDLNSKKYQMLKELYVSFAENEVKPLATELDEEKDFLMKQWKKWQKQE